MPKLLGQIKVIVGTIRITKHPSVPYDGSPPIERAISRAKMALVTFGGFQVDPAIGFDDKAVILTVVQGDSGNEKVFDHEAFVNFVADAGKTASSGDVDTAQFVRYWSDITGSTDEKLNQFLEKCKTGGTPTLLDASGHPSPGTEPVHRARPDYRDEIVVRARQLAIIHTDKGPYLSGDTKIRLGHTLLLDDVSEDECRPYTLATRVTDDFG